MSTSEQSAAQAPVDDRATTFRAMTNEPEHYSSTVLLVSAYAVLWTILVVWLGLMWRKQTRLGARISDLERAIAASAQRGGAQGDR
ncbi:MAG: hypothetical protein ABTD50_11435 [Polyangiaceae bacterium]